jgi:release factor glutamine methyltransferase
MKALDKMRKAKEILETYSINNAIHEAELIVSHCMNSDRVTIYRDNPDVPKDINSNIDEFLKRRIKREPIQYILGYIEFYGLKIKVGPGVLIPRPETELLVEEAIKAVRRQKSPPRIPPLTKGGSRWGAEPFKLLDLCTGSGCIALALAREFPEARVYGTDMSGTAIEYAIKNAEINSIINVTFIKGSLFEPVKDLKFDLIISNPPYIRKEDLKNLQPEIRNWEPVEALDGGEDGLDYYKIIIPEAGNYLKEEGYLMLELGVSQAEMVRKMAQDAGFMNISLIKDFAGIERIIVAKVHR